MMTVMSEINRPAAAMAYSAALRCWVTACAPPVCVASSAVTRSPSDSRRSLLRESCDATSTCEPEVDDKQLRRTRGISRCQCAGAGRAPDRDGETMQTGRGLPRTKAGPRLHGCRAELLRAGVEYRRRADCGETDTAVAYDDHGGVTRNRAGELHRHEQQIEPVRHDSERDVGDAGQQRVGRGEACRGGACRGVGDRAARCPRRAQHAGHANTKPEAERSNGVRVMTSASTS
jgi:hypothetical protein